MQKNRNVQGVDAAALCTAARDIANLELSVTSALEVCLHALPPLDADDCQTGILRGLGQAEEYEPQHALRGCGYGQRHLCEGDDVTWYTQCEDYHSRAKR